MTNQNEEQIDAYLMGKLSETDRQQFEAVLKEDAALATAVAERKELVGLIEHIGDQKLQERLKKVAEEYHAQQQKVVPLKRTRLSWIAAVAAGVALLIAAYLLVPRNASPQELYASYYETYPLQGVARSEQLDSSTLFQQVRQYYPSGQYEQVLPLLDTIYQQTEDSRWLVMKANALMQVENYQEAVTTLLPLAENNDLLYEDQARWYLALAYLQTDQITKAKAQLSQLVNSSATFKSQEAAQLLKDLK